MTEFITEYGIFLAKAVTIVIAILVVLMGIVAIASRGREAAQGRLEINKLNENYDEMANTLKEKVLNKEALKKDQKENKRGKKQQEKKGETQPRMFILNFDGDIKASNISSLREEITAILTVATPKDEVFLTLQSGGGLVHAYGLAASQLMRIKERGVPLTIAVDKIAASGGYMMSCVADKIIAAPFSIIGSIGVIAQIPNFHKLLKKHDIEFEQLTAGEFKRTLTMFGENTDKGREKFQEELEDTHSLFKEFIKEHRPQVDIDRIATGEHWPARRALEMKLVDELKTSDDYLFEHRESAELFKVTYQQKKSLGVKLGWFIRNSIENALPKTY